jgi:SRSO17 transposase
VRKTEVSPFDVDDEGRSYLGFHHHCALVTAAHGFLTLERQNPNRPRPA